MSDVSAGDICRVCASKNVNILLAGVYAPFFRLRVDTLKDPYIQRSSRPFLLGENTCRFNLLVYRIVSKIRRMLPLPFKRRAKATDFRTDVLYCTNCHAIMPRYEYSYDELLGLYRDYREESYNRDRVRVEPGYAKIVAYVGNGSREIKERNHAVDVFFEKNANSFIPGNALDYGGSDGRLVPASMLRQFAAVDVFDASEVPLHPSVDAEKIHKIAVPQKRSYALVTCMHILEHVGNPREFFQEAMQYVIPGGMLYIEIPLELPPDEAALYGEKVIDRPFYIHEHINQYGPDSIATLVRSLGGFEIVDDMCEMIDNGWCKPLICRILVRKK